MNSFYWLYCLVTVAVYLIVALLVHAQWLPRRGAMASLTQSRHRKFRVDRLAERITEQLRRQPEQLEKFCQAYFGHAAGELGITRFRDQPDWGAITDTIQTALAALSDAELSKLQATYPASQGTTERRWEIARRLRVSSTDALLLAGLIVILIMLFAPPWTSLSAQPAIPWVTAEQLERPAGRFAGYHFVTSPPENGSPLPPVRTEIDLTLLTIQLAVAFVVLLGVPTLKGVRPR